MTNEESRLSESSTRQTGWTGVITKLMQQSGECCELEQTETAGPT